MAHYEHLPIYRDAMKLAIHLENTVRGFSRYAKYTLGSEMRRQAQTILGLVIRANSEKEKTNSLTELRITIEQLMVTARLCRESNAFKTFEAFSTIVDLAGQVARQNEGWLRSMGSAGRA
jgi:hypothetical protein